jgi:hypothetical protein
VPADFYTAQAANDNVAVVNGDTIHLEPSRSSYGDLTCTKRLTWISIGNFLNIHPNQQFSPNAGKVGVLTVNAASSANSVFHINAGSSNISASGVRIERCLMDGQSLIGLNGVPVNIVVIDSYFNRDLEVYFSGPITITNNIIQSFLYIGPDCSSAVVSQNVINAFSIAPNDINNATVTNNIFNKTGNPYNFINCSVHHNMSGAAGILPAGNNNQNGVAMNTVFVNNNGIDDASFVLKTGSPAIGAGSGTPAANLGAYGGTTPFKPGLQPAIPAIYKLAAKVSAGGNTYTIIFSTRNNN